MGQVNAQITLKNAADITLAKHGVISEREIRQETIDTLVDTGAMHLVITNELAEKLGLSFIGQREARLANDSIVICKVTEPVEIYWEDRCSFPMSVMVVDGASENLLGVIPLEAMDLIVDPINQRLVGAHGDSPLYRI
jgi:clan AA aspartic protease